MEKISLVKQMIQLYSSKTNAINNFTLICTTFQHLHATSSFALLSSYYKTSDIMFT